MKHQTFLRFVLLSGVLLAWAPWGSSGSSSASSLQGFAVSTATPAAGQALVYNGSQWAPGAAGFKVTWPYVEMVSAQQANGTLTCHLAAGSQTSGSQFALANVGAISGVNTFWYSNATTYTLKCSLWDVAGGSRLASGTVANVNATGVYSCAFSSAYTFTPSQLGQLYMVTVWETTGAEYTSCNGWNNTVTPPSGGTTTSAPPWSQGPYALFTSSKGYSGDSIQGTFALFCGGDCKPTGNAGSELYVVEPVWQ